jgi:2-phosphoglycerate kinase
MEALINIIPTLLDDEDQENMNTLHAMVTESREDIHEASG